MRVLVCGGRDFADQDVLFNALHELNAHQHITCIIHGGARGADFMAGLWAQSYCMYRVFYADWKKDGKAAGPIRNQLMIDEGKPDTCVAFPGGRGTADMIARCKKANIPVWQPMKESE